MRNQHQLMAIAVALSALLLSSIASQGGEKSRLVSNLEAGKKQTVVTYGTSLTAGGAWVGQLAAELSRRYPGLVTVINSGKGAMWSKWGVDNLNARVIAKRPDTVLTEFSINDAYLPYNTSIEQARSNLETMVDHLLATNESCEIILMVMNPPTGVHLDRRPQIESYNQMYRDVAAQHHLTLIDHYPNWQQILKADQRRFSAYVPDGIHPNAEGCKMVITPSIISALGMTPLLAAQVGDLAATDPRNIRNGLRIPAKNYCDQPYVVVTTNGEWVVVLTTGVGEEGSVGQHVASARSSDQGKTWSALTDIEPPDGPEASWAVPFLTPDGRIYVFYTYNGDRVKSLPGSTARIRTDTLGWYCFKYSDDNGRSWSAQRYRIPVRVTACDLANQWGGKVQIFWGIDKPKVQNGRVRFAFTKLGRYFLENGEGWLIESDNLLTERDPNKLRFVTLPDGEHGIRNPVFGSIQEEHNLVPLDGDDLFCVYRLDALTPVQSVSRDNGHTWSLPERMTYGPGARALKQPRACPKLFKTADGRFLFWFHNQSGKSFKGRNPVFLTGGTLHKDGFIRWSEPEILLFDPAVGTGMSYPDLIEQGGRYWVTETQKSVARVHEIDPALLEDLWNQASNHTACANGLLTPANLDTFGALAGRGLSLELLFNLASDAPGQTLFSKTDTSGKGVTVKTSLAADDSPALTISLSDGKRSITWDTDPGRIRSARAHHVVFICDFSARIISVVLDGRYCDGDAHRQYGWGRIPPELEAVAVTNAVMASPVVRDLRLYGRALRTSEAVGNYRSRALPVLPPDNESARTVACWPLDAKGSTPLLASAVNGTYTFAVHKKAPGATNTQFAAAVPNPDTTPRFAGDPSQNAGAVFFDTSRAGGHLTASNLGSRVEFSSSFTVEGWVCRTSDPAADLWYVCGARESGAGWMLTLRKEGPSIGYHLYVYNNTVSGFFPGGDVTQNPGWHHLALVYDAQRGTTGTWELFMNGISAGVLTNATVPGPHGIAAFNLGGRAHSTANTFIGLFDFWRVSSGARTPATFLCKPTPKGLANR